MLGYLAGAVTTSVIVGIAIVEWLHNSNVVGTTKHSLAPGIDVALGLIVLLAAFVIQSGRVARARERRADKRAGKAKKTPRWQEALGGGTPRTTFVIGLLLSFAGASYLAALTELDKQNFGIAGDVVTILAVTAVMLVLLELPLLSFAVAPEWTPLAVERFKGWMGVHGGKADRDRPDGDRPRSDPPWTACDSGLTKGRPIGRWSRSSARPVINCASPASRRRLPRSENQGPEDGQPDRDCSAEQTRLLEKRPECLRAGRRLSLGDGQLLGLHPLTMT